MLVAATKGTWLVVSGDDTGKVVKAISWGWGGSKFYAEEFECYSLGNEETPKIFKKDASLNLNFFSCKFFGSL